MRLDIYLAKHHNIQSRNKASELIKNAKVTIDGNIITKSSFNVEDNMYIQILQDKFYVSRAAYKLKYFLEEINIDLNNKTALDIGSSTGGFTQILLENNIKSVTCVDVGTNQLHNFIKEDKRVIIKENTDIRKFISTSVYDIVTCDISFISILNIIDDINRLSSLDIIILYKPQFEVGYNIKRDSKGVVQDKDAINKVKELFIQKTKELKWRLVYANSSKLAGKNGNVEELFYFKK